MVDYTGPSKLCPECQREPIKSRMYSELTYSQATLILCHAFYDEEGRWHDHRNRPIDRTIYCPAGHSWTVKVLRHCWCGWPDSGPYAEETNG